MRISWEDVDKYGSHYKLVENYNVYAFVFDCADDMEQVESNSETYIPVWFIAFRKMRNTKM